MDTTRFKTRTACSLGAVALVLAGCVSVPRGPALTLANAGITTTDAFGAEIRDTAARVQYVDLTDAFYETYTYCRPPTLPCVARMPTAEAFQQRQKLAAAILLRAKALDALGKAYGALKAEAEYDARGDLVGATNDAISGVNGFAAAIGPLAGAAPIAAAIKVPLELVSPMIAGALADRNQRKRLIAGSREIAAATLRLRQALAVEAYVFDTLTDYLVNTRLKAQKSLLDSGIASNSEPLQPFAASLDLELVDNVDAVVAKSPAAKQAIVAMLTAKSMGEVQAIRNRYQASLSAFDALLRAHEKLEAGQGVTLADVERFLAELDGVLGTAKKE